MTNNIPETETKAAFSRRIGVSRQHVGTLAKSGLPIDSNGDVKVREALAWIRKNVRPANGALLDEGGDGGLIEARTRLLLAQAAKAELELAQMEGGLVDLAIAKRAMGALARTHRDGTLAFAARRGPELAGQWGVDPRVVVADLDAALRVMLEELAAEPVPFEGNDAA